MDKKTLALLFCLTITCSFAFAEDNTVEPAGVYATIDTKPSIQAINILRTGTDKEKTAMAMVIESHSDKYCPAVFFSLAAYLFDVGKTDDALFWLYAGRIRTQYDIKICTDETVAGGYEELNMSVPDLLKVIQFENLNNTKIIVQKAIKWDKETPINYDSRWIALHGMGAFTRAMDNNKKKPVLTIPEKEWKDVAEKNRKEYWDAFQEDLNTITPEQFEQIRAKIKSLKQEAAAAKK
ncbi:MAG: hypothetical protein NTY76_00425 [Candidatus Omnitrophica bacterium]|nr:hypothetical protein [Candidatus Omnitrophota bacterium]